MRGKVLRRAFDAAAETPGDLPERASGRLALQVPFHSLAHNGIPALASGTGHAFQEWSRRTDNGQPERFP